MTATDDTDDVEAAARRVALARARLHAVRRDYTRHRAGSADVAVAEAQLHRALDALYAAEARP